MGALLGLVRTHRRSLEQTSAGGEIDDETLVGMLGRLLVELERPMKAGQVECDDGQSFEDLAARLDALVEQLDKLADRDEDEGAGIERRVQIPTKVQAEHKIDQPISPKSARGRKASDVAAAVMPPLADGWRFGTVRSFSQLTLSGTASFIGVDGSEEVPIGATAFRKSGLTNLFAGDYIECLVESRGEGRKEIVDLKRSVASRRANAIRQNPHAVLAEKPVRSRYFG